MDREREGKGGFLPVYRTERLVKIQEERNVAKLREWLWKGDRRGI